MSTVKIEPFSFDMEEGGVQLKPEQLPGAIETSSEEDNTKESLEAKPVTTTKDSKKSDDVVIEETEEEQEETDDNNDPLGLLVKTIKSLLKKMKKKTNPSPQIK